MNAETSPGSRLTAWAVRSPRTAAGLWFGLFYLISAPLHPISMPMEGPTANVHPHLSPWLVIAVGTFIAAVVGGYIGNSIIGRSGGRAYSAALRGGWIGLALTIIVPLLAISIWQLGGGDAMYATFYTPYTATAFDPFISDQLDILLLRSPGGSLPGSGFIRLLACIVAGILLHQLINRNRSLVQGQPGDRNDGRGIEATEGTSSKNATIIYRHPRLVVGIWFAVMSMLFLVLFVSLMGDEVAIETTPIILIGGLVAGASGMLSGRAMFDHERTPGPGTGAMRGAIVMIRTLVLFTLIAIAPGYMLPPEGGSGSFPWEVGIRIQLLLREFLEYLIPAVIIGALSGFILVALLRPRLERRSGSDDGAATDSSPIPDATAPETP